MTRDAAIEALGDLRSEGAAILAEHRMNVACPPGGNRVYSLGLRLFTVFLADHGTYEEAFALLARVLAHFDLPSAGEARDPGLVALDDDVLREGRLLEEKVAARSRDAVMLRWLAAAVAAHVDGGASPERLATSLGTALHNAALVGLPGD